MGKKDFDTATKAVVSAEVSKRNLASLTLALDASIARGPEVFEADVEHAKLVHSQAKAASDYPKLVQEAKTALSVLSTATAAKIKDSESYL